MGTYVTETWYGNPAGQTRKQRQTGTFAYYIPEKLCKLDFEILPDVSKDIVAAESALQTFSNNSPVLHNTEGIARLLLRAEAVSSSYIEGLTISTKRLLEAEFSGANKGIFSFDERAVEVLGNVYAMQHALRAAYATEEITVDTILEMHRKLCEKTKIEKYGGQIRQVQNWVGGTSYNPLQADYVPPAPEYVEELLDDLTAACNDTKYSPIVQAALIHAQFEAIHPFIDGNGRTGRALIQLVLQRRLRLSGAVPPVSLVLATHSKDYIEHLNRFCFDDVTGEFEDSFNDWLSFFAKCCVDACEFAKDFERKAQALKEQWAHRLGKINANSALAKLLDEMITTPVFSVDSMVEVTGKSNSAVTDAIKRCIDADIVVAVGRSREGRCFEAPEAIALFSAFERQLGSPMGDTEIASPARSVPIKSFEE